MSTPILLDCDPGIDDALAIAFAHGHSAIELAGITTVAGNVGLARTTRNALAVADFVGATAVPVAAGCAAPLLRPALDASRVHGESGLGGAVLPDSARGPEGEHAADFLIRALSSAPGEITLVATGPLTNVAMAVRKEPRITEWAREFVIMGGSAGRGNVTPAAEFNIWADPEAAAIAIGAGWTVRMIGLDVTLRALATAEVRGRMGALGGLARTLLLPALADYREEQIDPAVHDVCAVASVAAPEVFGYTPARVDVETTGRLTSGMTVTDFRASEPNAAVATGIHADAFWDLVLQVYQDVADGIGA